jgi:hypothetical protein
VAYKVFTNGSVLNASEINDNLMNQSVAVFSNAAARTAAITSPVEGQMTYLESGKNLQFWNGSAWVSPFGLTLLNTVAMNATTVDFTNVFTSEFDSYKVFFEDSRVSAGSAAIRLRLLANTTPATANSYFYAGYSSDYTASSITSITGAGGVSAIFLGEFLTDGRCSTLELIDPNSTSFTMFTLSSAGTQSYHHNGVHALSNAYNGFRIYADGGGTITGTARIYGYRNA